MLTQYINFTKFRMELVRQVQYRRFVLSTKLKESDFNSLETLKKKLAEIPILKKSSFALLPERITEYNDQNPETKQEIEVRSRGKQNI